MCLLRMCLLRMCRLLSIQLSFLKLNCVSPSLNIVVSPTNFFSIINRRRSEANLSIRTKQQPWSHFHRMVRLPSLPFLRNFRVYFQVYTGFYSRSSLKFDRDWLMPFTLQGSSLKSRQDWRMLLTLDTLGVFFEVFFGRQKRKRKR